MESLFTKIYVTCIYVTCIYVCVVLWKVVFVEHVAAVIAIRRRQLPNFEGPLSSSVQPAALARASPTTDCQSAVETLLSLVNHCLSV